MSPKSLLVLGLMMTACLALPAASATVACTAACAEVTVQNNFTVNYRTCDSHDTVFLQVALYASYCSGGNSTGPGPGPIGIPGAQ
ncbi:MAG: hypothetical protein LC624_05295 [Halobacteriales archaeon]|nr:hypothetical protein [Halobacteriales archaeon]